METIWAKDRRKSIIGIAHDNVISDHSSYGGRAAKIELRRKLINEIGPQNANVFDAFCGEGDMFGEIWQNAHSFTGCDLDWAPEAPFSMYVADNTRVLRAIDLSKYNIFDLDAYGSPFEAWYIIAKRRVLQKREKIGFVATDGTNLKMQGAANPRIGSSSALPRDLCYILGVKRSTVGIGRMGEKLHKHLVGKLAGVMHASVEKMWLAKGQGQSKAIYLATVLVGK